MLIPMVTFLLPSEVTGSKKFKMAAKKLRFLVIEFISFPAISKVFHQNGLNSAYTLENVSSFKCIMFPLSILLLSRSKEPFSRWPPNIRLCIRGGIISHHIDISMQMVHVIPLKYSF